MSHQSCSSLLNSFPHVGAIASTSRSTLSSSNPPVVFLQCSSQHQQRKRQKRQSSPFPTSSHSSASNTASTSGSIPQATEPLQTCRTCASPHDHQHHCQQYSRRFSRYRKRNLPLAAHSAHRSFSTSISNSSPQPSRSAESPAAPTSMATHARSPDGPSSWWHRAFSFSSSQAYSDSDRSSPATRPSSRQASPDTTPSPSVGRPSGPDPEYLTKPCDDINALMQHPDILENVRSPRNTIVLCHGLYGFDVRGPFFGLEIHYWAVVLDILRKKIGADVVVRGVPGTGSIAQRAKVLHDFLCSEEAGVRGKKLNFIGHSMGGLDARYLISHLKPKPEEYTPVSLTTISTPHKGSPFMDWCNANVGIGNEYVDRAIQEYQESMKSAQAYQSTLQQRQGSHQTQHSRQGQSGEEAELEPEKLPYSLKTPLFVRPKKEAVKAEQSASQEQKQETAADGSSSSQEKETLADEKVKEAVGQAKEETIKSASNKTNGNGGSSLKSLASLGFVTPLTRALSSLSGSFSAYMLSVLDTPAYAMLSTRYMSKVFNPSTPDSPHVSYFSIAARTRKVPLWHPLWLPKVILDAAAESRTVGAERDGSAAALGNTETQGNDGLVAVQSAKWGTFLGVIEQKDHWDLRGSGAPRWGTSGKVNPATGKPWANGKGPSSGVEKSSQEAAEKMAAQSKEASKNGGGEESWLKINKLLGGLIGSKSESSPNEAAQTLKEEGQKEEPLVAAIAEEAKDLLDSGQETLAQVSEKIDSSFPSKPESNGESRSESKSSSTDTAVVPFVDEVAGWISDRLPQGSAERRKLANETAQQQEDDYRENLSLTIWNGSDVHSSTENEGPVSIGSPPTITSSTTPSSLLESSPANQTSEASVMTLQENEEKKKVEEMKSETKEKSEKEELEKFWIALCQHLYSHGF
ncbi:unnamed protein product [Sympodiomycopsis kandeliae]